MLRTEDEDAGRVRALKFQALDEDARQISLERREDKRAACPKHQPRLQNNSKQPWPPGPNHSQPAVVLENVCFEVNRSEQQANILKECLFRLNQAMAPICCNSDGLHEQLSERVQILKSVNLSVPRGSIFGLLGPSSCGKTSLLRCLLGLLQPSSGSIRLFGKRTSAERRGWRETMRAKLAWRQSNERHEDECRVPGPDVGYMPQDLGLYEDFSIAQLLTMFGSFMRMDRRLIRERIAFMANFLELPDVNRQIQSLSGGQKRRVSFAVACLHMPPLIILDEPTVGVDPLLRSSIWKYLRRLASEENKTIIITTHYIEEAAQADQVALMRAGEILVQDSPGAIMKSNNSATLEEAFLKICNNVGRDSAGASGRNSIEATDEEGHSPARTKLALEPVAWQVVGVAPTGKELVEGQESDPVVRELKLRAQEKLALYDRLKCAGPGGERGEHTGPAANGRGCDISGATRRAHARQANFCDPSTGARPPVGPGKTKKGGLFKRNRSKFILNEVTNLNLDLKRPHDKRQDCEHDDEDKHPAGPMAMGRPRESLRERIAGSLAVMWALLYKNYRRNMNSIPLLAFQFMLPMIQMISFCLCVGGRPTNIGLGIVNRDSPIGLGGRFDLSSIGNSTTTLGAEMPLSLKYLSFLDKSMLAMKHYDELPAALEDVRRQRLWAVIEIGANFTEAIGRRFDLDEDFYQLDSATISQSIIRIYPDRSNKILDMICQRSLVDSFGAFMSGQFEQFRRLPIELARPIFDIKPNAISNSIDGYTESIAPGLLASLTYIMAAGLTTFIMVMDRSDGILERTYTSGINPVAYLLAHAIFRSLVMMAQIALALVLTFYILKQPLVGSIWLAYSMLMVLNMTGIAYGLLVSSLVTDQNGAALIVVSSLVFKINLSGILWPLEAVPHWLRALCLVQPLTMPVQALKNITLKGAQLGDTSVVLGFLVALGWLLVFLVISARRFKFYQH